MPKRLFGLRIVTRRTLTSDELLHWAKRLIANNPGEFRDNDSTLLDILAAAEHCLRTSKTPVPLFVWIVANRAWHVCSNGDYDIGSIRLKDFRRRLPHSKYAAKLAEIWTRKISVAS